MWPWFNHSFPDIRAIILSCYSRDNCIGTPYLTFNTLTHKSLSFIRRPHPIFIKNVIFMSFMCLRPRPPLCLVLQTSIHPIAWMCQLLIVEPHRKALLSFSSWQHTLASKRVVCMVYDGIAWRTDLVKVSLPVKEREERGSPCLIFCLLLWLINK